MRKRHYIQFLLVVALISNTAKLKAQIFVEAGIGFPLIETNEAYNGIKSSNEINLQIGKFVSFKKMRSFSFGYKNTTYIDETVSSNINGTLQSGKYTAKASIIALGYERKVTIANTEFDDVWQFYNIVNYHFSIANINETITNPKLDFKKENPGNSVSIDLDLGLGMARKFSTKTYAYIDARGYLPIIDAGYFLSGVGIKTTFGVRHVF